MIFTTDLDRTLIYSARVLSNYPSNVSNTIVEAVGGRSVSFTSTAFFNWLKSREKGKGLTIVANTARSINEFNRLNIHNDFDYAIMANGGVITHNGKPIKDWEDSIKRGNINELLSHILEDLNNIKSINYKSRTIDDSYIFTKTLNDMECTQDLKQIVQKYSGISFMVQRGKVYIIPKEISKANAINWLSEYIGEKVVLAAGDSETDLGMLRQAEISIVPKHSDIIKQNMIVPNIETRSGLLASIDILEIIKSWE